MTDARVTRRIDRWLDGDLSDDEERAFGDDLARDPANVAMLADRALLHGLLGELAGTPAPASPPRPRRETLTRSLLFTAAGLLVAASLGTLLVLPRAAAGPTDLVEQALAAARTAVDRRYAVRVEPADLRAGRRWASPPEATLWVRDDRFVQSTGADGQPLAWGRGPGGEVWFALSPRAVAIFAPDEIPDGLRDVCDLRTLDLTTLLETILEGHDLRRVGGDRTDTILARPRRAAGKIGAVTIEIDRESLRVTGATLERLARGRAVATVRFTLEETATVAETTYDWRSHVDADATILDRTSARGSRRDLLAEFLRLVSIQPRDS